MSSTKKNSKSYSIIQSHNFWAFHCFWSSNTFLPFIIAKAWRFTSASSTTHLLRLCRENGVRVRECRSFWPKECYRRTCKTFSWRYTIGWWKQLRRWLKTRKRSFCRFDHSIHWLREIIFSFAYSVLFVRREFSFLIARHTWTVPRSKPNWKRRSSWVAVVREKGFLFWQRFFFVSSGVM